MSEVSEKVLALPTGVKTEARVCFFAIGVPVGDRSGRIAGVQLQSRACDAQCALFDRDLGLPCLTAATQRIVAALEGLGKRLPMAGRDR